MHHLRDMSITRLEEHMVCRLCGNVYGVMLVPACGHACASMCQIFGCDRMTVMLFGQLLMDCTFATGDTCFVEGSQ